jgi:hypothetical protein
VTLLTVFTVRMQESERWKKNFGKYNNGMYINLYSSPNDGVAARSKGAHTRSIMLRNIACCAT